MMERYIDPKYQKPPKTRRPHRYWAKGVAESGLSWADCKLERRVYVMLPRKGAGMMTADTLARLLRVGRKDVLHVAEKSPRIAWYAHLGVMRTR